ncbi:hypothetical protein AZF37_03480 [endosymbiont 'TC1' of Trimyema compressum]|uniref:hypothetical protein n=1 Tax=endosymbiont 'TC1' of Trimyema compressum TaxID=243899 RepID=UPI0007F1487C|nr:hypothetical protein [endosymbiont 'TC1' of Trimyema compressum]AMP20356.1 hypothetical protein AZF37_03480 [endosymbiont 'TC1' of Trimyema compressum]
MKYRGRCLFILNHILLLFLIILIVTPSSKLVESSLPFIVACFLIELFYLLQLKRKSNPYISNLMVIIWLFFIVWEILVTKLNLLQPILFPAPENVFNVLATQYETFFINIVASTILLFLGYF